MLFAMTAPLDLLYQPMLSPACPPRFLAAQTPCPVLSPGIPEAPAGGRYDPAWAKPKPPADGHRRIGHKRPRAPASPPAEPNYGRAWNGAQKRTAWFFIHNPRLGKSEVEDCDLGSAIAVIPEAFGRGEEGCTRYK
jgi:hypothetical protein